MDKQEWLQTIIVDKSPGEWPTSDWPRTRIASEEYASVKHRYEPPET